MKIGSSSSHFGGFRDLGINDLDSLLDKAVDLGLEALEFGAGPLNRGQKFFDPAALLSDHGALENFKDKLASRGIIISALQCHGNPLHPDREVAELSHMKYLQHLELAVALGVERVITYSGCPAGGPHDRTINWITSYYPRDLADALNWQWNESVIPYWTGAAKLAVDHGIKVALELHPGMFVHNVRTLQRLREAVGPGIGANVDTGHVFETGADPILVVRELRDAVYYVHAKDAYIDPEYVGRFGLLDSLGLYSWVHSGNAGFGDAPVDGSPYGAVATRPTTIRSVGYGHDLFWWKRFVTELRFAGYDFVLSIEQNDPMASILEGLEKTIAALRECVLREPGLGAKDTAKK